MRRWVLLFLVSRLAVMLLSDQSRLFLFVDEELYRGTIGRLLDIAPHISLFSLRTDDFNSGAMVFGWLASRSFRVFGPTVFALKLIPVLWFTAALWFWQDLAERFAGRRTAVIFSALFVFSPPSFTAYSLTAMGFHSDTVALTAATLWLFFKQTRSEAAGLARAAALGSLAGFSLWFSYHYALTLAALALYWLWRERRMPSGRRTLLIAAGFLAGFWPWLALNLLGGGQGWVVHGIPVWSLFRPRGQNFVFTLWATSFGGENWPAPLKRAADAGFTLAYAAILTCGLIAARRRGRLPGGPLGLVALLYLVLFAAAAQACALQEWRYFAPAYPFVLFFVAASLDGFGRAGAPAAAALTALSIFFNSFLLSPSHSGEALTSRGYTWRFPLGAVCFEASSCARYRDAVAPILPPGERRELEEGVAEQLKAL